MKRFGRIGILVNNVGCGLLGNLEQMTTAEIQQAVRNKLLRRRVCDAGGVAFPNWSPPLLFPASGQ
jgi:hypothetical protein